MKYKDLNKRNFVKVLEAIEEMYDKSSDEEKDVWVEGLDDMLDNMWADDFFGTEGENDPRGDHRD